MSLKKFTKVDNDFVVNMYDNGYMVEIGGQNKDDDWVKSRIVCNKIEEVLELVKEIASMPRDN